MTEPTKELPFRKTITLLVNVNNPHTNTFAQKTYRLTPEQMLALKWSLSACIVSGVSHDNEKKAAKDLLNLVS